MRRPKLLLAYNRESCKICLRLQFIQENLLDYPKPQRFISLLEFLLLLEVGEISNLPKIDGEAQDQASVK